MIVAPFDLPGFDVQEYDAKRLHLCCRTCKLTWYLPKDPARRTKDATTILAAHAATHLEDDGRRGTKSPRACRVCGGAHGFFERVAYVGAPDGGVPVHPGCLATFFGERKHSQHCSVECERLGFGVAK